MMSMYARAINNKQQPKVSAFNDKRNSIINCLKLFLHDSGFGFNIKASMVTKVRSD